MAREHDVVDDATQPASPPGWADLPKPTRLSALRHALVFAVIYMAGVGLFHGVASLGTVESDLYRLAAREALRDWSAETGRPLPDIAPDACPGAAAREPGACLDLVAPRRFDWLMCDRLRMQRCIVLAGTRPAFENAIVLGLHARVATDPCRHLPDPDAIAQRAGQAARDGTADDAAFENLRAALRRCPDPRRNPVVLLYFDEAGEVVARYHFPPFRFRPDFR